jgi:asparagine synthase (glutamine-hydrolysing)
MCGIAGYVTTKDKPEQTVLKKMTDRIAHRGPDGEGFYLDDQCGLGHRRLAIIDLDGGDQPIYSNDRRYVIVYNGEIYNYKELRAELKGCGADFYTESDTEAILAGFAKWGTDVVSHLRGMFAFAIWDKKEKTLFCFKHCFSVFTVTLYNVTPVVNCFFRNS